ncbi:MAG TPA: 50S ribosomal protein L29, partial [Candidatus Micrarchaeota archaeon]|nr:50S ribosomal protein L29 [Candidatus Micrarchaeota archaeon]
MAILRKSDIRSLDNATLFERLVQLKGELNREIGLVKTGGRATNPGRISELRITVSRILTILHERKLGINKDVLD